MQSAAGESRCDFLSTKPSCGAGPHRSVSELHTPKGSRRSVGPSSSAPRETPPEMSTFVMPPAESLSARNLGFPDCVPPAISNDAAALSRNASVASQLRAASRHLSVELRFEHDARSYRHAGIVRPDDEQLVDRHMTRRETILQRIHLRLVAPLALLLFVSQTTTTVTGAPPLLQRANLQYTGAFRLPPAQSEQRSFGYGAMAMADNAARNSLYMVGHVWYQQTAEVSIPAITQAATPASLTVSTLLQWGEATDGNLAGAKIYGQLVHNGALYGVAYNATRSASHFRSGLALSVTNDFQGFYQVGTLDQRFVAGYMAQIPPDWQTALGDR